MVINLLEFV